MESCASKRNQEPRTQSVVVSSKKMRAGRLRHRIALQSITGYTKNEVGEKIPTWTTYATVWAAVDPKSGDEAMRGVSSESTVTPEILIRYNGTVSPKHQIIFKTRTFKITAALDSKERNISQKLMCHEVVT